MLFRMASVLVTILVVMAPITSQAASLVETVEVYQAMIWRMPDLIAMQDGHKQAIAPPLTDEELQTVREGIWHQELLRGQIEPTVFQKMAYAHLRDGGALRAGDFVALHGSLLSASQPNTYALAKKWQGLMKCVGDYPGPECREY
jgi:hypothetical protein